MELVLASNNNGKLREFATLIEQHDLDVVVRPQSEFGVTDAIEDGVTFIENSLIKARHASSSTGLAAIADDSGLVVPALGGAPGILSARYAGEHGDHAKNIALLLSNMRHLEGDDRRAQFVCVLTLIEHQNDPLPLIAIGTWDGIIHHQMEGMNGFGYDPIFIPQGMTITAAELPNEQKIYSSHRARALVQLFDQMKQKYDPQPI